MAAHLVQGCVDNDLVEASEAQWVVMEVEIIVSSFCQAGMYIQQAGEWADPLQILRLFQALPQLTFQQLHLDKVNNLSR